MDERLSIGELGEAVNRWCDAHGIAPANNQAGDRLTDRNIRFYRTIGLLDAPESGGGQGYNEKHKLQLIAVRLLQSQGQPLRQIRALLLGRSLAELRRIQKKGLTERPGDSAPVFRPLPGEAWRMVPLDAEFLLISRQNRPLPAETLEQIRTLLRRAAVTEKDHHENQTSHE